MNMKIIDVNKIVFLLCNVGWSHSNDNKIKYGTKNMLNLKLIRSIAHLANIFFKHYINVTFYGFELFIALIA